ncbi:MAG: hypothetical protein V7637_6565 [Mycobacteriales bacterium]|jgi:hypothetical protein
MPWIRKSATVFALLAGVAAAPALPAAAAPPAAGPAGSVVSAGHPSPTATVVDTLVFSTSAASNAGVPTLPDIYCFISVDIPRWGQSGSTQYVSAYGEVRCTETVDEISLSVFAIRADNAAWEADAFVIQWPSANTVAVAPCATMRWVAEADALVIPPPGYHPEYRFSSDVSPVVDISCRVTLPPPPQCPAACAREDGMFSQPAVVPEHAKAAFRTKR